MARLTYPISHYTVHGNRMQSLSQITDPNTARSQEQRSSNGTSLTLVNSFRVNPSISESTFLPLLLPPLQTFLDQIFEETSAM